ncbi:MAG: hypothetical protein IH898_08710, partial [Planctomycetes bacterium]|nr:hypothetical protein [Planctomycetota bacterium]
MRASQVILCATSFACLVLARPSVGGAQLPPREKHLYIPTDDCLRCHSNPSERDKAVGTTDRVRLLEWIIWKDQDKHSKAYGVLHEARGQRIGELMDQNVLVASTGCVQCHTSNVIEHLWSPACFQNGQNAYVAEGVSCQTCHGPAEQWQGEHIKDDWITRSDAEKTRFGLNIMEN